ncbi:hypothetical protein HanIR_Chr14g0725971 [Helianthus annuus]|nr:hypothetical protein HanIR_Chr14g0725971 [Helianthus annuus]
MNKSHKNRKQITSMQTIHQNQTQIPIPIPIPIHIRTIIYQIEILNHRYVTYVL